MSQCGWVINLALVFEESEQIEKWGYRTTTGNTVAKIASQNSFREKISLIFCSVTIRKHTWFNKQNLATEHTMWGSQLILTLGFYIGIITKYSAKADLIRYLKVAQLFSDLQKSETFPMCTSKAHVCSWMLVWHPGFLSQRQSPVLQ